MRASFLLFDSQISRLMTEIGIVIQECYVYSSTDRYLFGVFLVDGWNTVHFLLQLEFSFEKQKIN